MVNKHTNKTKKKMSESRKRLYKEGKIQKMMGANNPMYGKPRLREVKEKISNKLKGKIPWNKGAPRPKETKEKLKKANLGKKHSKETKIKIGNYSRGKTYLELYGEKKTKILKENRRQVGLNNKGRKASAQTRKKMRLAYIKYIEEVNGNIYPKLGRNETKILNIFEKQIGYKIIRQYPVIGYFLDGYIPELNIAIEIDEKHHTFRAKEDNIRQKDIMVELNCSFLRIKDY